jgi:hypothetical protein
MRSVLFRRDGCPRIEQEGGSSQIPYSLAGTLGCVSLII